MKGWMRLAAVLACIGCYFGIHEFISYVMPTTYADERFFYWWAWGISIPATGLSIVVVCAIAAIAGWVLDGFIRDNEESR